MLFRSKMLKSKDEVDNKATTEKSNVEYDSDEKEDEETMGKGVETNEAKVQSSSPPLAPKISFSHRLKK